MRITACSSDIGFSSTTGSRRGSPGGRRSRAASSGATKLQPATSKHPRAASASPAARRWRCTGVSRPPPERRVGNVAGRRSSPWTRATSSIRSTSRRTSSRRWDGTVTSNPSPAAATANPSAVRISALRSRGIGAPSSPVTRSSRRRSVAGAGPGPPTSIVPGTIRAPQRSTMSRVATTCASSACSGARPFSKRAEASLRRPSAHEVRWMFGPFQLATSISTRVVPSPTSERAPPITPAIEVGPSASSITSISPSRRRRCPSSVSTSSPSCARRTTRRPPATRSRSKAWSG